MVRRGKGPHSGPAGLPHGGAVRGVHGLPGGGPGHHGHGDPERGALHRRGHGHGPGGLAGAGQGRGGADRLFEAGVLRPVPRPAHHRQPLRPDHQPLRGRGGPGPGGGEGPHRRHRGKHGGVSKPAVQHHADRGRPAGGAHPQQRHYFDPVLRRDHHRHGDACRPQAEQGLPGVLRGDPALSPGRPADLQLLCPDGI